MAKQSKDSNGSGTSVLDVGSQQVGRLYAKALLGATEAAGQTEAVLSELDSVVAEVLEKHPDLETLFGSEFIAHEQRESMLDRIFSGRISPMLLNFLKVLSSHSRLGDLRAVQRAARQQYNELRGRVLVEVRTAHPMDQAMQARITASLRSLVPGEPIVETRVDPDLIGGIIFRVGDTVYDGSVATRLEKMRQQMIDRSVHEIQSGRDRFRYPEGN